MSAITTHVLDTARGRPAAGLRVTLALREAQAWKQLGDAVTGLDGRAAALLPPGTALAAGWYRLTFDTLGYQPGFFPEVTVTFEVSDPSQHYHVPLLLSPFGYSTYRGA